ncbi:hypothetical protein F4821DRAFT_246841 [Hypoxylon rubiginosum]|uniref:Uncharacterized protein n=1 Tax=Hypoxylon rubiginosum TaxID=110542 RepID=A0ACC0CQ50_9PEZI|nr:hypothetical protein F4821DRAFT_246841 [Hypoxylon rubiginosum]
MAYQNTATTGAIQNNFGLDITLNRNIHYHIATVATAQQFGSPLRTRYSYNPLHELIQATNDADIAVKRYYGDNIYGSEKGKIMTASGHTREIMMQEVTNQKGEHPTQLSTIIVCLSVYLDKRWLSPILASAIMLFTHGQMDKSMEGDICILQEKIEKYAGAVLSRDGMCNKLENAKSRAQGLIKSAAPHIQDHTLFLPPRTPAEEGDFVEFIVELWSARIDGEKIYTRSVKLLALALLLSEYGWQVDVFVESDARIVPVKGDIMALSVIYSSDVTSSKSRQYIENHNRYVRMSRSSHPTASCIAAHMGEVTSRSFSASEHHRLGFMAGYNSFNSFCDSAIGFQIKLRDSGKIRLGIQHRYLVPATIYHMHCWSPVNRCMPREMPLEFKKLVALALHEAFPNEDDWKTLSDELEDDDCSETSITTLLSCPKGDKERLWSVAGATICALDRIILSLVNLPSESLVRIPVYESLKRYIFDSVRLLEDLLSSDEDEGQGLEPGRAVELCAIRLAGLEPGNPRIPPNFYNIIGYWNAQQGILLTSILERTLYFDLPTEKQRPLTFFNTPIMGMPTDDGDWIKAGTVDSAVMRRKQRFHEKSSRQCDIVIEYRPNFERDSNTVVAAVFMNGVFSHLLALSGIMSQWYTHSRCEFEHPNPPDDESQMTQQPFLHPFDSFEPGEIAVPPEDMIIVVGPQVNTVSRFFSSLVYKPKNPVIQNGCWNCVLKDAKDTGSCVIIPRPEVSLSITKPSRKRKADWS